MKRIIFFLLIILASIIFFTSFFWLYETKYFIGRASTIISSFAVDNSYVFVTPLQAKANKQEKIRVSVFILNNQGLGVNGKRVIIDMNPNLIIETVQGLTDNTGKAIFNISSAKVGEYYLEIKVDGQALKQAHLSFN